MPGARAPRHRAGRRVRGSGASAIRAPARRRRPSRAACAGLRGVTSGSSHHRSKCSQPVNGAGGRVRVAPARRGRARRCPRGMRPSVSRRSSGDSGRLVGIGDAGEVGDLAGEGLRVQALHVASCALLDARRDVHLDERGDRLDELAGEPARIAVGRDGRDDHGCPGAGQAARDPADALDVEVAVLPGEAEAPREMRADDIAVEGVDEQPATLELGREQLGDGGLAGARRGR